MSGNSSPSHSSDASLSLSPALLADNNNPTEEQQENDKQSSISEHISSLNSVENDRSLLEIEIHNIPDIDAIQRSCDDLISNSPPLSTSTNSATKNAKSVLEEILHNEHFHSERSDRLDSNDDASLNIFAGVNLDDSSINNYVLNMQRRNSHVLSDADDVKVRSLEEAVNAKDSIIQALTAEVESLKDMASNPSTMSLNTTLTEYKQFQEECTAKLVEYENALVHRDSIIGKLKETLVSTQKHEDDLRVECEQYSKDIQCLQKELAEAVEYMKSCKLCKCLNKRPTDTTTSFNDADLNVLYEKLEGRLVPHEGDFLREVKEDLRAYVDNKLEESRIAHQLDIVKLKEKHVKEMDDTRKFYERKCADILSDDLVSQHSRKPSEDDDDEDVVESLEHETPIAEFLIGPGGDGQRVQSAREDESQTQWTAEALQTLKRQAEHLTAVLSRHDLDALDDAALNSLSCQLASVEPCWPSTWRAPRSHQEEINALRKQVRTLSEKQVHDASTQANSGEYEIDGIVKSYQVQLAEQVALAKLDIIAALEENISMLAASECDDDDWPKEFLEIRNKLSTRYTTEIADMRAQHEEEISRLKQEHLKALNNAASRAARRSLDFSDGSSDVLQEQRKTTNTLRSLLVESYKYFAQCEEELNTTLFEELAKQSLADSDSDLNLNDTSTSSSSKATDTSAARRVHLAPNISEFIAKIDQSNPNVSLEFKHELGACLDRLRADANAILALTMKAPPVTPARSADEARSLEERIQSLTLQVRTDSQIKEELTAQLAEAKQFVKTLEIERRSLEKQLEEVIARNRVTESDLGKARDKIGELIEYGRKEIVSEGYGEITLHGSTMARAPLTELQERARLLLVDSKETISTAALKVIEDLCHECDHLSEDGKREREDFLLQIDSADKKLKATQRFLEEQAAEREQERDEALKTISSLKEQLKDRDRDRAGYERVNEEKLESSGTKMQRACCQRVQEEIVHRVEGFEQQMREMSQLINEQDKRYRDVNTERKEAIEKIGLLRDIIKDLEVQVEAKTKTEVELKALINKQREANDELVAQLEAASNATDFQTHILHLEEEVTKLRRASDIVGNEGLIKQIQLQLHDLEISVDKNIREIESLYATKSTTTCSTPSEEMSAQDHIRPKTPNSSVDDCEVPLQQLARLREKLLKHARAENSSIKRIQDLELQLVQAKDEHDEMQSERDVLQEQVSEQLVLISSLQMRLDDQRIRAEHVQKQANASLEMRIYDLENDLQAMRDKLQSRENTIKQLNRIIDDTKQRLKDREEELSSTMEEAEVSELKTEVQKLKTENEMLRAKIESDAQNAQILPSLVDNIISDKNRDIDVLRSKLEETERQFEMFKTLNSTEKTDEPPRNVLSFFNISSPEQMRDAGVGSLNTIVPEISSIERIGSPNVHYTIDAPLVKPNSTEIQKSSSERRVHFEDESSDHAANFGTLHQEIVALQMKLHQEEDAAQELRVDLAELKMHLTEKESDIRALQDDAKRKDDMYVKLMKEKREIEKQFDALDSIRKSVEDLRRNEELLNQMLAETKGKFSDKEDSYEKLNKEYENYKQLKEEEMQLKLRESQQEMEKLVDELGNVKSALDEMRTAHADEVCILNQALSKRVEEIDELHAKLARVEGDHASLEERLKQQKPTDELQNVLHKKNVAEKELQIVKLKTTIDDLKREIIHLQDFLNEKDKIIETMKLDSETLRVNLETIKAKMSEAGNVYELRERLVRERQLNAQLGSETEAAIDDIGDQVRQQLHDSAHLDDTIINALASGDSNSINDNDLLRSALHTERKAKLVLAEKVTELEAKLEQAIDSIKQLQNAIEEQRKQCADIQVEDTQLMDQMRVKLEEALENEIEYATALNAEKQLRVQLEAEVAVLRKRDVNSVSSSSKTEYKSLGNVQEQRLQAELVQLHEEVTNLKREAKALKKAKTTAESGLKYTKDLLNVKAQEIEKLEARLAASDEAIRKVKDSLMQSKQELDTKTREIEHSRTFIDELALEKQQLLARWAEEKHDLQKKLRLEMEKDKDREVLQPPFDDPVARANHLFGKYLRADSYRNALAYQKKYLIGLLATYQEVIAHPLSKFEPDHRHRRKPAVSRFRSAVVVCIAIFRMQYMVKRWHSGSRSGAYLSLQRKFRNSSNPATQFQVGQPVSSEHFRIGAYKPSTVLHLSQVDAPLGQAAASTAAWSGLSPPSKDVGIQLLKAPASTSISTETTQPLAHSAVAVESYIERFNLIQQRLGMALNSFNN